MTETTALAVADKGLVARAFGVIFAPGATFQTVKAYPRPAGIMFIVCLVIGLAAGLPQMTERGRQAALDMQVQQAERFTGQPVAPDAYARMKTLGRYGAYVTVGSIFIFLPVTALLFAGIYWVIFNGILAGTASFKQVLGVVTHSSVIGALGAVAAVPIQLLTDAPINVSGPFNLGALVPMLPPGSLLANFLGGISFFTLWQVVVSAIGLSVLYKRRATGIAIGLIAAYLAIALAVTSVVSSFTGR